MAWVDGNGNAIHGSTLDTEGDDELSTRCSTHGKLRIKDMNELGMVSRLRSSDRMSRSSSEKICDESNTFG
uniref:Uncharacterized protein n=1 Tax=Oryza nivara TaxID=4536 RepID=A0A0E0ID72_ORYNI